MDSEDSEENDKKMDTRKRVGEKKKAEREIRMEEVNLVLNCVLIVGSIIL